MPDMTCDRCHQPHHGCYVRCTTADGHLLVICDWCLDRETEREDQS